MTVTRIATDQWPSWAKALLIANFALIVAVLIPWIVLGIAMAAGCMGMGPMQMPRMPMTP